MKEANGSIVDYAFLVKNFFFKWFARARPTAVALDTRQFGRGRSGTGVPPVPLDFVDAYHRLSICAGFVVLSSVGAHHGEASLRAERMAPTDDRT